MVQKFLSPAYEAKRLHDNRINGLEHVVVIELWFGGLHRLVTEYCVSHMAAARVRMTFEHNLVWDLCVNNCLVSERFKSLFEIEDNFDFTKHGRNTKP